MNPDVTIKIIGIFAIFALSLLGYIIPLNAPRLRLSSIYSIGGSNWTSSSLFHVTKAFSSGVILGVALLHLVAESLEILDDYSLYPIGITVVAAGLLFSIGIDQLVLHLVACSSDNTDMRSGRLNKRDDDYAPVSGWMAPSKDNMQSSDGERFAITRFELQSAHEDAELTPLDIQKGTSDAQGVAKLYIIEVAIAIHSIILGFGFGIMDPLETIRKGAVWITALSLHQFFEGFGLSTTILSQMKQNPNRRLIASFGLVFSVTFPIGSFAGILSADDTVESQHMQGIASAFAGGLLLHAALVEMIAADFNDEQLAMRPSLKILMYLFLLLGFVLMAILASMEQLGSS